VDGLRFHYEYNDRGRGPSLDERVILGAGGVPVLIETTGNDYFKNAVSERFTIEQGAAKWVNSAENGGRPVAAPAFYVSLDGVPAELALLARAIRTSPGRKLALFPEGEAGIEELGKLSLAAEGKSREVTGYAVTGLSLAPVPVWLDADGMLFAIGELFLMSVREGWEASQDAIMKAQTEALSRRSSALARSLARDPGRPLLLRGGDLFDAESGKIVPNAAVVIDGNRIAGAGPRETIPIPVDAEIIDTTGKTILPGMWDMHVHMSDDDGLLHLAAGVTTVRDLANDTDELLARRRRFDEGTILGPRIVLAGIIDGSGPLAGPTKVLVDTEAEARAAVDRYAGLGYAQIKIYSSVKPELVPPIVDEAHKKGMRVSGHVPAFMTAEEVVKAGYDEIQHANFLFLNFWGDTIKDTRTPLRFTAVAEKAADLDLGSDRVQGFIRLLKERGTVLDPTLNAFEAMFKGRKGEISPGYEVVADRMPAQVRRGFLTGGLPVPEGMDQRYRDSFSAMLKLVKRLHDAGVPIVAGTDALAGFSYHRELELYEMAGIPAADVLRMATLGAAKVMKLDRDLGSVASGKLADLIVVDGHPARRIADIRRVSLVIKDGKVHDVAALQRSVGVEPMKAGRP
jgi:imidazolonepropionase-like amidohydrolase